MAKKKLSFEASLKRLEEIVKQMESGNCTLDESLKLFEEGNSLVTDCNSMLDTAEMKITKLTNGTEGIPAEEVVSDEYELSE